MTGASTHAARVVLVGGGVRSGKSAFALARARRANGRRVFVATAQAFDSEMRARIAAHRAERGDAFETIEEPIELVERLAELEAGAVVVVDCLTLWLSNLLLADLGEREVRARSEALVHAVKGTPCTTILVTNEVGMGVVPESALGRAFRDASGTLHQLLSRVADEIYLAILGTAVRLRPSPLELCSLEDP